MSNKAKMGRPSKFNESQIEDIEFLIVSLPAQGKKVTWANILKAVNEEVCSDEPTTVVTLKKIESVNQTYKRAKETATGNVRHEREYGHLSRDQLLDRVKSLKAELDKAKQDLVRERERKVIEFETFLTRQRGPAFYEKLRESL